MARRSRVTTASPSAVKLCPAINLTVVEQDHVLKLLENGGWDERIEVIEVGDFVRSHIVYAQHFTVVYDTLLGPLSGQWLAQRVTQRNTDKPVLVIVSHSDWDHCWGNQCFDVPIIGLDLCAQRMLGEVGQAELASKRAEHPSYAAVVLKAPTFRLSGEATLDAGDLTFRLLHTPGHRPDHLALYLPEIATLLPGDAVETPFALLDECDPVQDLKQMRATLRGFLDLPIDWLLPNHAPPQPGSGLIQANLDYYERLCDLAAQSDSLEKLQESFPYSGPSDQEFYVKDHQRIVAAAWQAQSSSRAIK